MPVDASPPVESGGCHGAACVVSCTTPVTLTGGEFSRSREERSRRGEPPHPSPWKSVTGDECVRRIRHVVRRVVRPLPLGAVELVRIARTRGNRSAAGATAPAKVLPGAAAQEPVGFIPADEPVEHLPGTIRLVGGVVSSQRPPSQAAKTMLLCRARVPPLIRARPAGASRSGCRRSRAFWIARRREMLRALP
jgi:hypothetical protein